MSMFLHDGDSAIDNAKASNTLGFLRKQLS